MKSIIKEKIEGTLLAAMYRLARDEWLFSRKRFIQSPLGFKFTGRSDMQAGLFEPDEVELIRQHLEVADVFVDIGANIGYFTCIACSMGKHTFAIEPHPGNLRYLYANLQINGWTENVEVYAVGLAAQPGLALIYGSGTGASLLSGWAGTSPQFHQTISLSTLDILLDNRFAGKHVVIKIDVEGAEYAALLGSANILKASPKPIWLIEITLCEHRQGTKNQHFLETFELFWSHGYDAWSVGPSARIISRYEIRSYERTGNAEWKEGNYLFVPTI